MEVPPRQPNFPATTAVCGNLYAGDMEAIIIIIYRPVVVVIDVLERLPKLPEAIS